MVCAITTRRSRQPPMYQDIFGKGNFFIEVQDHGIAAQRKIMDDLAQISKDVGAPLLAANDSHYTYADEADAHDVLLCIQTGANKSDEDRFRFDSQEFYVKSAARCASCSRTSGSPVRATTRC